MWGWFLYFLLDQFGYITEPKKFILRWHQNIHITLDRIQTGAILRCCAISTAVGIVKVNTNRQYALNEWQCTIFFTQPKLSMYEWIRRTTCHSLIIPKFFYHLKNVRLSKWQANEIHPIRLPACPKLQKEQLYKNELYCTLVQHSEVK